MRAWSRRGVLADWLSAGMWRAISAASSNDSAASPQKLARQPMAAAASVPIGMPNSRAAEMPR